MKPSFTWPSLLAFLANLFAAVSGQNGPFDPEPPEWPPESPWPAWPPEGPFGKRALANDPGPAADFGTAVDIGPAVAKLSVKPDDDLETGRLIKEFDSFDGMDPHIKHILSKVSLTKGSILETDLKKASYVANPGKVIEQLLSNGEGIPEIKQGKIVAGDPVQLDVLTLKKRRPREEAPIPTMPSCPACCTWTLTMMCRTKAESDLCEIPEICPQKTPPMASPKAPALPIDVIDNVPKPLYCGGFVPVKCPPGYECSYQHRCRARICPVGVCKKVKPEFEPTCAEAGESCKSRSCCAGLDCVCSDPVCSDPVCLN